MEKVFKFVGLSIFIHIMILGLVLTLSGGNVYDFWLSLKEQLLYEKDLVGENQVEGLEEDFQEFIEQKEAQTDQKQKIQPKIKAALPSKSNQTTSSKKKNEQKTREVVAQKDLSSDTGSGVDKSETQILETEPVDSEPVVSSEKNLENEEQTADLSKEESSLQPDTSETENQETVDPTDSIKQEAVLTEERLTNEESVEASQENVEEPLQQDSVSEQERVDSSAQREEENTNLSDSVEESKPVSSQEAVQASASENSDLNEVPERELEEIHTEPVENLVHQDSSPKKDVNSYKSLVPVPGNTQPKYPGSARENGQEGSVLLLYFVDNGGLVDKIQLLRSSGYSILDNEALRTMARHRYLPGQSGWYKHRVDFKIKKGISES